MQAQQQTEISSSPTPLFWGEKLCFVNSFHPNVFFKNPHALQFCDHPVVEKLNYLF
jgi:hypothetical protein